MKQLRIDLETCGYGRDCAHECEAACAAKVFRTDDPARAALHVRDLGDGRGEAVLCDQCGDCVAVCPAEALQRNRLGVVMINKHRCVACYLCVGFCEKGIFERNPAWLEPYKCTACGICVKACPRGALAVADVPEPAVRIV